MKQRLLSGFTILELAIVLTIIGLILGAIAVGSELIKGSEIRGVVSQLNRFNTAVSAFNSKYDCLPGDCDHAVALGLGTGGSIGDNGNGDSKIGVSALTLCHNSYAEMNNFWYHLAQAKLLSDPVTAPSVCSTAGTSGVQSPMVNISTTGGTTVAGSSTIAGWWILNTYYINTLSGMGITMPAIASNPGHVLWITAGALVAGTMGSAAILPTDASAIDIKIDDGLPMSGNVQASSDMGYPDASALMLSATGGHNCVASDVTPYRYNVTGGATGAQCGTHTTNCWRCSLLLKAQF